MTILQHNINTWDNKKFELYNTYRHIDPHIILLNHHGLTDNKTLNYQHYTTYTSNKENSKHRGTAILVKDNIQHTILDDFETDLLAITVPTRQGPVTIATDYIAPHAPYLHFIDYYNLINRQNPVYILGDLNARHPTLSDTANRTRNKVGTHIHQLMELDKIKHIGPHFPTFITSRSSTTPDIVLGNNRIFHNIHLTPGPLTTSDHIPTIAKITAHPIQIPIRPRKQFNKANWEQYRQDLSNINFTTPNTITSSSIDNLIQTFNNHINTATENHIPTIRYRIIPGAKSNDTTRQLQTQYNNIYREIQTLGHSPARNHIITNLKTQLRTEYQKIQTETWNEIVENINLDTDPLHFWKSMKRFQGNEKQKIPYIKDHHNNKIHETENKETHFRNHWKKIFQNQPSDPLWSQTQTELHVLSNRRNLDPHPTADITRLDNTFPPIMHAEIVNIIKRLKHKAPGPSGITATQLQHLPANMTQHLTHIYNLCLSIGYFPRTFKHATMIFIPKTDKSQHHIVSYRPISLLDVHGKILDKILNTRLDQHITLTNNHNPRQHGFRHNRGVNTALATFYETIAIHKLQKHNIDIVLRDVKSAFDKVWHVGLKQKILNLNLHPCFTKILSNFITDRTARIRLDTYTGQEFTLHSGVPQGACLSPTLFNLYTHDIPDPAPYSQNIMYADDISQIIHYPGTHNMLARKTIAAIETINHFENKWLITTNTDKFDIIALNRQNKAPIIINDRIIPYKSKGKILGLTFSDFSIKPHIAIRIFSAKNKLTKLQKFKNLTTHNKLKLYKTIILPTLTFPTVPINTISRHQMLRLQRIQNLATRFITDTRWSDFRSSETLHNRLNLDPVNIFIHKQAHNTWENIQNTIPDLYTQLSTHNPPIDHRTVYKSSRLLAEQPIPPPIYT